MNKLLKKKRTLLGIVVLSVVVLFSFAITAHADMTIHFTLVNSQQSDPDAAWWAGKSNMLFDHNNSGFPGADDMVWDWWGYNKDFTGTGHYYFSEINFDCHEMTGGGSSGTPNCSVEDYYFKGLPCGYIDRLRESDDARDSTFDLSLSGSGPVYDVDYGDTLEVYGWALVKAIMRHTSDFSFAEPGQGAQASGGTYDSATNVLDAWVNINFDFINPIPSDPSGMSPVDTQEAWVDGFEQKGFIIPKAEFTAWHDGTSVPEAGKYMVPTYTLGTPPGGYPDEYIETGLEDMGPWLDDLVDDNLGSVWSEIENADYLYIAFSRDNFVIDDGDYTSVDSDGIAGNEGKTSADGANLIALHPEAWPILAKTFLNDEVVWIAAGYKEDILMPDLIISEKSEELIEPSDPSQGYKVNYTVKNQGGAAAGDSTTGLTIDGTATGNDQSCPALDPGETHSGTFEGPFICSGDSDTIEVCADCDEEVTEGNEGNNCKENEWTCSAVSEPDLVISEKSEEWINPSDPSQGYKVNYTVKNQGGAAAGTSNTSLDIDGTNAGGQSCPALDSGAVHLGTFDGPFFCDDANDTVKVCADSGNVVEESDETNNCKENEWICSTNLFDIRNGAGEPGSEDRKVEVWLKNGVGVAGIQVDICDVGNYLSLPNADDVELTDRAAGFICDFEDDHEGTGCARLVLYSESGSVIAAGDGPILILHYDVDSGAGAHSCVEINSENLLITDEGDNPLTAAEDPGSFFLGIYGDPWPYDDVSGTVGDGEVNIFDVVRDLQIILETYTPTDCELVAGDVPTGFGVDCQAPDENIIIFDVVEIVAKILGRANCIDTY